MRKEFYNILFSTGLKTVGLFGAIGEFTQPHEERNTGVILGCVALYALGELYKRCVISFSQDKKIGELEKKLDDKIEEGFLDINKKDKIEVQQDSAMILNQLSEREKHYLGKGL